MNFKSDNTAIAHPQVLNALMDNTQPFCDPYGYDTYTKKATEELQDFFQHKCKVVFTSTGTATNSLAIATITQPWHRVYCASHSHIVEDECNAVEKLASVSIKQIEHPCGKITTKQLDTLLSNEMNHGIHQPIPSAISLVQATDLGCTYSVAQLLEIKEVALKYNLKIHMDGARLANAIVYQKASPAELTWKSGVDILSFGTTKVGTINCEALVIFDQNEALYHKALRLQKQTGQLYSKMRYQALQLSAILKDNLILKNAQHANQKANELRKKLTQKNVEFFIESETNELFITIDKQQHKKLQEANAQYYIWQHINQNNIVIRLVTSWNTSSQEIDNFNNLF